MASNSSIEWTDDTFQVTLGCTKVSPGCANCYAETMSGRLAAMAEADIEQGRDPGRKGEYRLAVLQRPGTGRNGYGPKSRWSGKLVLLEDALDDMLKLEGRGRRFMAKHGRLLRVFLNSESDLFHRDVPFGFVDRVMACIALSPSVVFQVLTKRPERMAEYLRRKDRWVAVCDVVHALEKSAPHDRRFADHANRIQTAFENYELWPLPNVWLGTSVEDQKAADERIPHLLRCPAAVRFLSCEPLLGPVDLTWPFHFGCCPQCRYLPTDEIKFERVGHWIERRNRCPQCTYIGNWPDDFTREADRIHWVIAGGESGPGARPMHPDWVRGLRDQCQAAGVPYFFKQWGAWVPATREHGITGHVMPETGEKATWIGWDGRTQNPSSDGLTEPIMAIVRVGKKAAGRELGGCTWDEMPNTKETTHA